jgi:hypothetical protein
LVRHHAVPASLPTPLVPRHPPAVAGRCCGATCRRACSLRKSWPAWWSTSATGASPLAAPRPRCVSTGSGATATPVRRVHASRPLTRCWHPARRHRCGDRRATGDARVVQVVRRLREKRAHFRLLGLSATPGNEHPAVQVCASVCVSVCVCVCARAPACARPGAHTRTRPRVMKQTPRFHLPHTHTHHRCTYMCVCACAPTRASTHCRRCCATS